MNSPQLDHLEISWGGRTAIVQLRRSNRRMLRIEVRPSGELVVFAPQDADAETIAQRLQRKGAWIFRELDRVSTLPALTPERRFVSGETHLVLGRQYRLSIESADEAFVYVNGSRLVVFARRADDHAHIRRLVESFYAITARRAFAERLDVLVPSFARKGLQRPSLVVRKMSKRWGSYTPKGRIVLNVDLVRASPELIDYVICHELAHAFFPDHGKGWRKLLETVVPDWETRKDRLEFVLR